MALGLFLDLSGDSVLAISGNFLFFLSFLWLLLHLSEPLTPSVDLDDSLDAPPTAAEALSLASFWLLRRKKENMMQVNNKRNTCSNSVTALNCQN